MENGESTNDSGNSKDVNTLLEELRNETEQGATRTEAPASDKPAANNFDMPLGETDELKGGLPPEEVSDKIKKSAHRYVKMFNSLMKLIFKPLYKKTILEPEDVEKMRQFRNKNRGKNPTEMEEALHSDDQMWPVTNRFDKFMKAVEDIPLDPDEIEMLAEPLSEVLNKYKKSQLSPEWMLVITTGMVMLPRIAPMLDVSKMFKE